MLKIGSIYYRLPIRRTMDVEDTIQQYGTEYALVLQLARVADILERLLKISEMRP